MKKFNSKSIFLTLAAAVLALTTALAQAPFPGGGGPGGRGGRGGGLPGATAEQTQAVTDMNTALTPLVAAATAARNELGALAFTDARNAAAIAAAANKLRAAELAVASARAEAFRQLQGGPNKLNPEQVAALIASGGNLQGGRGGPGRGRGN